MGTGGPFPKGKVAVL